MSNTVSPSSLYPNACSETSLYHRAVPKGLYINSSLIVQVYDSASGFEDRYNYWHDDEGLVILPVYVGPMIVMEGAAARWWNGTLTSWKAGDTIYGLYFRAEMQQPVGNTVKGPLVTIHPCHYELNP